MSQNAIAPVRKAVNYRLAEVPVPPIIQACRNCKHFAYDSDDRYGKNGLYFEKKKKRCALNGFSVISGSVCDKHEFKHLDKRDV